MSPYHKRNYFPAAHWMLAILLSLCPAFTPSTLNGQTNVASGPVIPKISMLDAPLSQAITLLAREADLNFILNPQLDTHFRTAGAKITTVNFEWENLTAKDALAKLLKEHDLVLVENPITSVACIAPTNLHIKPVDAAQLGNDTNVVVPVIMMTEAPLEAAIQLCADELHRKLVLDEAVRKGPDGMAVQLPTVTFRWHQLTVRQALVALLDNYGLAMVEDSATSTLHIGPKPKS